MTSTSVDAAGSVWYFSGTGNSRLVAQRLAELLGVEAHHVADYDGRTLCGKVGIVGPVYAWGIPFPLLRFAEALNAPEADVWSVLTCGDDCGRAPEMLASHLRRRNITMRGVWTVQMPNVYVLLPGFDVDSAEVETRKLREAPARIAEIAAAIGAGRWTFDVVRGAMPRLKTALVYPLFEKFGVRPAMWRVSDACISCGRCAAACPQTNIHLSDGRPQWGADCVGCLGCYHVCPTHAINYGTTTLHKGQYHCPPSLPE